MPIARRWIAFSVRACVARVLPVSRRALLGLLIAAAVVGLSGPRTLAQPATVPTDPQALVPANFSKVTDSLGFTWNFSSQGFVTDGTDNCFQTASELTVGGSNFNITSRPGRQMTPDGSELVLQGRANTLQITRRMRVDKKGAYLRYIDVFENTGRTSIDFTAVLRTQLSGSPTQLVTTTGATWSGVLGKNDAGVAALDTTRASLAFILSSPRSNNKPTVSVANQTVEIQYALSCKPGERVAIMHFLVPRNKMTPANVPTLLGDIVKKVSGPDNDVPAALRACLNNFGTPASTAIAAQDPKTLLQRMEGTLSENYQTERGSEDIVVIDSETRLNGNITSGDVTVTTAYGKATVPLAQIGAWIGGGGTGRPQQLYLRNGEVLTGAVEVKDLKMTVASGWVLDLNPGAMQAIALRRNSDLDGKVGPEFGGIVELQSEDAFALTPKQDTTIEALSQWGPVKLGLGELTSLQQVRDPQPGYRATLADKSSFLVFLQGKEVALNTNRFGAIKVRPQAIANLATPSAAKPAATDSSDSDTHDADEIAWHLAGDTVLAGELEQPELKLTTATGASTVVAKKIRSIERHDEEKETGPRRAPEFNIQLMDGSSMTGTITEGFLNIKCGARTWKIPAAHIVSYQNDREPETAATPDAAATPATEKPSPPADIQTQ